MDPTPSNHENKAENESKTVEPKAPPIDFVAKVVDYHPIRGFGLLRVKGWNNKKSISFSIDHLPEPIQSRIRDLTRELRRSVKKPDEGLGFDALSADIGRSLRGAVFQGRAAARAKSGKLGVIGTMQLVSEAKRKGGEGKPS